jgi:hypothetical protein
VIAVFDPDSLVWVLSVAPASLTSFADIAESINALIPNNTPTVTTLIIKRFLNILPPENLIDPSKWCEDYWDPQGYKQ